MNGKLVPLYTKLNNGDTVEVLTTKVARGPSMDWLNTNLGYANTANAQQKIRQWFRKQERGVNIRRGKDLLAKELRRLNLKMGEEEVASLLKFDSVSDLMDSLGLSLIHI